MIGGRPVPEHIAETALAFDPDDDSDAFYNQPGFEERFDFAINRNASLSALGELPPALPDDKNSQNVLAEATAKMVKE